MKFYQKKYVFLSIILLATANLSFAQDSIFKNDEYSIRIDVDTRFSADQIQFFQHQNISYIALLYGSERKIRIYNYADKSLVKEIIFDVEGPNGVGTEIRGFLFEGWEKIYVYSYWERRIKIFSADKIELLGKIDLEDNIIYPGIEPTTFCPIIKSGSSLFLSGGLENHLVVDKADPLLKVNLKTGKHSLLGNGPYKARAGNFSYLHTAYFDFNKSKKEFIVSFSISDSLYIFSEDKPSRKYLAKSKNISDIKPISMDKDFRPKKEKGYEYSAGPSYNGVLYDHFRNCYYRYVIKGMTLAEVYDMQYPEIYLMVFDENFKYLGEQKLPESTDIVMSFITEKGLHIANKKHYDEVSEDELMFDVYKLKQ